MRIECEGCVPHPGNDALDLGRGVHDLDIRSGDLARAVAVALGLEADDLGARAVGILVGAKGGTGCGDWLGGISPVATAQQQGAREQGGEGATYWPPERDRGS